MWLAYILGAVGFYVFIMSKGQASEGGTVNDLKPTQWDDLFKKYANENGIDWRVLKTIAMNESSLGTNSRVAAGLRDPYNIKASTSYDGLSWGLMQMTVTTAKDFDKNANEVKLNNPEYSIKLSAQFVRSLYRQFNGKIRDVVMAYNHGAGNQKRFVQKENEGTLKNSEFLAGRAYWDKYQKNHRLLFG